MIAYLIEKGKFENQETLIKFFNSDKDVIDFVGKENIDSGKYDNMEAIFCVYNLGRMLFDKIEYQEYSEECEKYLVWSINNDK